MSLTLDRPTKHPIHWNQYTDPQLVKEGDYLIVEVDPLGEERLIRVTSNPLESRYGYHTFETQGGHIAVKYPSEQWRLVLR